MASASRATPSHLGTPGIYRRPTSGRGPVEPRFSLHRAASRSASNDSCSPWPPSAAGIGGRLPLCAPTVPLESSTPPAASSAPPTPKASAVGRSTGTGSHLKSPCCACASRSSPSSPACPTAKATSSRRPRCGQADEPISLSWAVVPGLRGRDGHRGDERLERGVVDSAALPGRQQPDGEGRPVRQGMDPVRGPQGGQAQVHRLRPEHEQRLGVDGPMTTIRKLPRLLVAGLLVGRNYQAGCRKVRHK